MSGRADASSDLTPWARRFVGLIDDDEITKRVEVLPTPRPDLAMLDPQTAADELLKAFEGIFLVTPQRLKLIKKYLRIAERHSARIYTSEKHFRQALYRKELHDLPVDILLRNVGFPEHLTGLAGVGKSALVDAIERALPLSGLLQIDNLPSQFPLNALARVSVGRSRGEIALLSSIRFGRTVVSITGKLVKDAMAEVRRRGFQQGTCLLIADEFQFITRSDVASTLLVSNLFNLQLLAFPLLFVANFSLGHRVKRRHQEEKDRLLSNVEELLPEENNSSYWIRLIRVLLSIAPDAFDLNPERDCVAIHNMTFGINRTLTSLLALAYKECRAAGKRVTLKHLQQAYLSPSFASKRADVEILKELALGGRLSMEAERRRDLISPFTGSMFDAPAGSENSDARAAKRASNRLLDSLTAAERAELSEQIAKLGRCSEGTGKVTPLKRRSKAPISVDELRLNFDRALSSDRDHDE